MHVIVFSDCLFWYFVTYWNSVQRCRTAGGIVELDEPFGPCDVVSLAIIRLLGQDQ